MVHPIIKALRAAPYNYKIEQVDSKDENQYRYYCADGISLCIHMKKPANVWAGVNSDEERVLRNNFTKDAAAATAKFVRNFNREKMDSVSDDQYPLGDDSVQEPEIVQATLEENPVDTNPKYTQTQLVVNDVEAQKRYYKAARMSFTNAQINAMRQTVAKGASQAEFEMFVYIAAEYGLDPFLKEIFFASNMKTILTSRDGYLKIAHQHPDFMGIRSMAVRQNDDFEVDVAENKIIHKFGKGDRGPVVGAWAVIYRKGWEPGIAYADLSEYMGNSQPWKKYTSAMICKCAEAFLLKRYFAISGLVTQEEMDYHGDGDPVIVDAEYVTRAEDAGWVVEQ